MSRFDEDDHEDTTDREVSAALTVGEGDVDASLRPRSLGEFIGQPRVREQLQLVIEGAKNRGGTPDHILLSGPPGLGKTSLAMIIAAELGTSLRVTSGPALERAGDLAAMLSNLVEHDVLFIDEIHRIARPAEEMLYLAMEDFRVDVDRRQGPWGDVDSARGGTVHARRGDHAVGRADRTAARPVRLHRPHGLLRARRTGASAVPLGRHPRHRTRLRGGYRDRHGAPAARPASPTGCCAGSATTPRCAPTASSRATSPRPRWRSTTSTSWASTGWTAPCSRRSPAASAAVRSECRRSRWQSAKRPRRSRRCASLSWCGRACLPALRVAGWPPRKRGRTWACTPPSG